MKSNLSMTMKKAIKNHLITFIDAVISPLAHLLNEMEIKSQNQIEHQQKNAQHFFWR